MDLRNNFALNFSLALYLQEISFSYNLVTSSLKKLEFKTQESTEFIILRPLVVSSLHFGATTPSLWVINSVDPCILKSSYYLVIVQVQV